MDALQQRAGVASFGDRGATLGVELLEDRRREQEVEDLGGLTFEYLGSQEIGDRPWRLREVAEEQIGNRFVAEGDGGHLDTRSPTLSAGREQLDLGARQLDGELDHEGGNFGAREPQLVIAHLVQLPMSAQSVQRELRLGSAAQEHATGGRQALDEQRQAGFRGRGELDVVDHDHDRLTERREAVHDRDRNVAEVGFGLVEHVGGVEPMVWPPLAKRGW